MLIYLFHNQTSNHNNDIIIIIQKYLLKLYPHFHNEIMLQHYTIDIHYLTQASIV